MLSSYFYNSILLLWSWPRLYLDDRLLNIFWVLKPDEDIQVRTAKRERYISINSSTISG